MTEELKVKLTLDTTGVAQGLSKVKSQLKSVEGSTGSMSGATAEASESMEGLQNSMRAIMGLEFANLMLENKEAVSNFATGIKDTLKGVKDHVANAFESLNPKSDLYVNVAEWNGWSDAVGNFAGNMREAKDESTNFSRAMKDLHTQIRPVTTALTLLSVALVPIAGTLSAFSAARLGKDIYNSAQRVGMGTQKYQEWAYILEQVGADVSDLIGAQQTLTEAQIDVAEGSEDIINAFKYIGLSAEEVISMDRQELFERTIAGLQNIENSTQRAAIGYRLLSEDASTLSALLGMSNQDTAQLANNFNLLGSVMSESLLKKSLAFSGALGTLKAAFQGLVNTLAELFLPILTTIVTWLTKAIAVINMFLRALFNMELTTSGTSNVTSGGIEGFNSYTDAVEGTESAVQKLRRTLMGFDELNVVDNPNSGSSVASGGTGGGTSISGGGVGGGLGDSLFSAEALGLDKWRDKIEKWKGIIQTLVPIAMTGIGAVGAVLCLMGGNWAGALAFATMAGIGFAAANVEGGLFDRLQAKLEKHNLDIIPVCLVGIGAIGTVINLLGGNWAGAMAFATMAGIGLSLGGGSDIANFVKKYEDEIVKVSGVTMLIIGLVGTAVALMTGNIPAAIIMGAMGGIGGLNTLSGGTLFSDISKGIKDVWEDLSGWFKSDVKPVFTKAFWDEKFDVVQKSASEKLGKAKDVITEKWGSVRDWFSSNVKPKFTKSYWDTQFDSIKTSLSNKLGEARTTMINAWNNVRDYFNTNIAPKFTTSYWSTKFDSVRAGLATKLGEARTTVMNAWNSIKDYFNTYIAPKFTSAYWSGKFDAIRAGLSAKLGEARTTVINGWNSIKNYYTNNIAPKFTKSYWTTKFNTIKDGAKAAFNGVISVIETAVNSIVNKVNTVSWKIPDWVPKYGGSKFGFNLKTVKIPRLATGGIAVNSTLANIGENGKEAILPLENNTGWMDALADKIAARNSSPSKIVLKVGEKELGWATIDSINQITKQTGGLQLVL